MEVKTGKYLRLPITDMPNAVILANSLKGGEYDCSCSLKIKQAWIEDRCLVIEIDKDIINIQLKRKYPKRSLDANAYAWHLIGELANVLNCDKEVVYLVMLRRYGQGGVVKIKDKDAPLFKKQIKYWQEHEKLTDENASYYRFWVGSSNYNTKEMSIFIDGLVSECKEQGIETMTPAEVESMMKEW